MIDDQERAALTELMENAARAMYDDCELNVDSKGVNPCEASPALQVVAELFGIPGPRQIYDQLCGE